MCILNLMLGLLTPPYWNGAVRFEFCLQSPALKIVRAVLPYLGRVLLIVLLMITFIPGLVTFLPNLVL